jgi:hypothetical protein
MTGKAWSRCQSRFEPLAAAAMVYMLVLSTTAFADIVVFDDTFASSTLNSATNSPTSTSTNYDVLAAKSATGSSIAAGDLKVAMASTSGAIVETQALFTSTPVTLVNPNDYIEMKVTFVNTQGISSATSMQLDFGLFNSGGSAPKNTLNNSGLSTGTTTDATGGAQNWKGYTVQLLTGTTSSKFLYRPPQTGPDNTNQDALLNNASSSQAYHNPVGSQIGSSSTAANITLTPGTTPTYTEDLKLTLASATTYSLSSTLTDSNNNTVSTFVASNATPAALINSWDALGIGWRITGTTTASQMDISEIQIITNAVPEASSFLLVGLVCGGGLFARRFWGRKNRHAVADA